MHRTKAVCLAAPRGAVDLREMDVAAPGPGEVSMRMEACGICHSDVMIRGLERLPLSPLVLGHEGIGIVEEVGEGVETVRAGDRVGITYFASGCGRCQACRSGKERYCMEQLNHGFTRHGALAGNGVFAAQNLIRVPDGLSAAEAAPLCCAGWTAMGALTEAALEPGQLLAIFGFGGLGHLAFHYARHMGLRVAVVDSGAEKLEFAKTLGAEIVLEPENARKTLLKGMGGADASIVFTASAAAVPVAFSCLRRCGSMILVGLTADTYSFSMNETVLKGARIQGSYLGSRADLERVFQLAANGAVKPSVTAHPLEEAPALIDKLAQGQLVGRAVITF
jgi:alcohol dehydrogenase, propanol-preferring